jgi:hypothetical protein
MERLKLVVTEQEDGHRTSVSPDPAGRLASLMTLIPDVAVLERLCNSDALDEVIDDVVSERGTTESPSGSNFATLLAGAYRLAINRGLQACPLSYLEDVVFAYVRRDPLVSVERTSAESILESLHRRLPNDVRFHVDRRGRRAFVLISTDTSTRLEDLLSGSSVMS